LLCNFLNVRFEFQQHICLHSHRSCFSPNIFLVAFIKKPFCRYLNLLRNFLRLGILITLIAHKFNSFERNFHFWFTVIMCISSCGSF
jgi:hypothetical protein